MEECDEKVDNVFDAFSIAIPCSASYFLKVGSLVSLKVATKRSVRGKNTLKIYVFRLFFLSKNGRVAPKRIKCF